MPNCEELLKKPSKDLLQFLANQFTQSTGPGVAFEQRNRDLAKAILDYRSAEIIEKLTFALIVLTGVLVALTVALVWLTAVFARR